MMSPFASPARAADDSTVGTIVRPAASESDRSGLYFAGYFIWERTNYEPRGIERRPHQAKALGHLDLAIQFASPGTANSATAPRLGSAGADFLSQYRSAQQRRFPEPFVREIEERFGDCLDTDHSAGRGNGMSGIVAGK